MPVRARKSFASCACGAALCCAAMPAFGAGVERGQLTLGFGGEGGAVFVDSNIPAELDRKGPLKNYKGFIEYHADRFSLLLGGGYESSETSGRDDGREVAQATKGKAANVQAGLFFNLGYAMQLGLDLRQHRGQGADYGIYRDESIRSMTDIGPAVRFYAPFLTTYLLRAEFAALTSTVADKRRVSTVTAGLSMSIPVPFMDYPRLRLGAKANPRPEDDVLYFDYASDELSGPEKDQIAAFAVRWRRQDFSARKIVVNGHASRAGYPRTNLRVSLRRALNVAGVLLENGVPDDAIELTGFGYSKLAEDVPPTYDEQRRVEIRVLPRESSSFAKAPSKTLTIAQLENFAKSLKNKDPKSYLIRVSIPSVATRSDRAWNRVESYLEILVREGIPNERVITRTEIRDGDIVFNIATLDGDANGAEH